VREWRSTRYLRIYELWEIDEMGAQVPMLIEEAAMVLALGSLFLALVVTPPLVGATRMVVRAA